MIPSSFDFSALAAAYRDGLDPHQVVREVLARITAADDPGIFLSLFELEALDAFVDALGPYDPVTKPLWGLPFAIKDNIDCAGLPTTAACPGFAFTPDRSAEVVRLLVAAGAIPIGKTNLDQFATGLVGVRTPYPAPRNSFDPALVPGGSSSGSAVAVARGLVAFALGTDTAGSGRVPAGLNNIVGLKPSLGAVSLRGVLPACQTLDCVSVLALTVPDAVRVFDAIAVYDAQDPWSRMVPSRVASRPEAGGHRIGVPDTASRIFLGDDLAEAAFDQGLALLRDAGHTLVEIDLRPFFAVAKLLYEGPWVAERYQAIRPFIESRPDDLHPVTRTITMGATRFGAADAFAGLYRLAALRRATMTTWSAVDLMVVPTYPKPVTLADVTADPIGPNAALGTYTNFVNLLDLCALSCPGPFRADGCPAGLTLIAQSGRDRTLARVGTAFHAATETTLGATRVSQPDYPEIENEVPEGWIELCVMGAHLSGLPLNIQLVALDAVFLRTVSTTGDYRLFALPGTTPAKPALMRVGDGEGHAIETEVWCLSPEAFGRFVGAIPAPLGIGTVRLADGTTPKGFLGEAIAVTGARDISHFGGWRAYLASLRA